MVSDFARINEALLDTWYTGVYTLLFACCVYVLRRKRQSTILLVAAATMFAIATADIALTLYILFRYVLRSQWAPTNIVYPKYIFFVTNK